MKKQGLRDRHKIRKLLQLEKSSPTFFPVNIIGSERIEWRLPNGKLHREFGPAVEMIKDFQAWYINGLLHREDGPAIISLKNDNAVRYYVYGKELPKEEFEKWQLTGKIFKE
jgi:hypothetical protein